jgi:phosphatidylinositol alpha 1,6-mannosyltransferase
MEASDLRIALFSGNYNYVRDGANKALNRLVGHMLGLGAAVRVYAPKVDKPAFEPTGDLVGLPSLAIPGRGEYRVATGLNDRVRRDLDAFAPNVVHLSSPDFAAHAALKWARARGIPVLASVHTRFETYLRYYGLGFAEPWLEERLRRFYRRCDALVAPAPGLIELLKQQGMHDDITLWTRGIERDIFHPGARSLEWRRSLGIADGDMAIGFLGRLVKEKGLDSFVAVIDRLKADGVAHKVLVVGEGPSLPWCRERVPDGCFVGFQQGHDLGRAVASMDVLFNPSVTETFGNVTLEAMACALPVVAARATGSENLVAHGVSGFLIEPNDIAAYAEVLTRYAREPDLRARHGAEGERRSRDYSWDRINQTVADNYLRLIARRRSQPEIG